jgi:hypothetical protein
MTRFGRTESGALAFALSTATLMIAHQVAGKATRDALFLSHFEVTELPKAVIAAAVLSMAGVLLMSRLLARYAPAHLVPAAFGASAILFACEWLLSGRDPRLAAIVLYLHMAVFGAILISGFWSIVNERFDPHSAKRTIARIAAAATLGGVLGGVLAERVAALVDVRAMLLVLSALRARSGAVLIARHRYLRQMGLLVVLLAAVAALVDYAFKATAAERFASGESLIAFFASFYATVGVATFLVQTLLGPRMLQKFGIGTTVAVLPAVVLLGSAAAALVPHLWSTVALRGGQAIATNSFFRSSFELLYTPVPPEHKRPTKTIIDVAGDRMGDMLGGGLILLLLGSIPDLPPIFVLIFAAAAAACALYLVTRLYRGYIGQLVRNLHTGSISLERELVIDATTRHVLAETSGLAEREQLMARVREHRAAKTGRGPVGASPQIAPVSEDDIKAIEAALPGVFPNPARAAEPQPSIGRIVDDLAAADVATARRALRGDLIDARLTPFLLRLLGDDELAEDARMELRWLVPRIIGQLTDALLDPDIPLLVRQRIPGVLEICHNPRSVEGLLRGLVDEEFNVRYACARALHRMRSRDAALSLDRDTIFSAVRGEVAVDTERWQARNLVSAHPLPADGVLEPLPPGSAGRSLEHVFTVLSLVLDPDALRLASHAVHSSDRNLRGTALEYLENVLPDDIRADLWRHLGVSRRERAEKRSRSDILAELERAGGSGPGPSGPAR